jgi:3-dehydroquinate synthase
MVETLRVELGARSYPILFGSDLSAALAEELAGRRAAGLRVAAVTDRHVATAQAGWLGSVLRDVPTLVLEPGEEAKSLAGLGRILDFLAAEKLDRTAAVVVIGGGVIGDLGGFGAAAYLRGIDYLQVPTTLLAMVDSSVGGKTGLNLAAGKNLAGAFHQPRGVYISTHLLATLPAREFAAGMAEVIKYGLLGDAALFADLEKSPLVPGSPALAAVVRRCCAVKAGIVSADEFERAKEGGRALLNLGHTFGHAIEQVAGYGTYLHGEAVAIGLCAAARLSHDLGLIPAADVARIDRVVAAHRLPVRLNTPLPLPALQAAMARDKKVRAGVLRFVVLNAVGNAAVRADVSPEAAAQAFREVGAA